MESGMKHFSHEHPLFLLKAVELMVDDNGNYHPAVIRCEGCFSQITEGPFYSCITCDSYCLHKVCADLPSQTNHPLHSDHPLTLLSKPPPYNTKCLCNLCGKTCEGFVYHCSICKFNLDTICGAPPHPIVMKHVSHDHPMILKPEEHKTVGDGTRCDGCETPIRGPFYSCPRCSYSLHKVCAHLPNEMDHPEHPRHTELPRPPLTLLSRPRYKSGRFRCDLCKKDGFKFVYNCSICSLDVHIKCALAILPIVETICVSTSDTSMMKHFSHNHPLTLKPEERNTNDGTTYHCDGCETPISGPFYSCVVCFYVHPFFLHKACAELPEEMNHPMHPEHPLTLLSLPPYGGGEFKCDLCGKSGLNFFYNCSTCEFKTDMICALASHTIKDKCHSHPLTPIQVACSFPCHICQTKEIGSSYKCNSCPFWVHQNCALLPDTVNCSCHAHILTLLPSVPVEIYNMSDLCDICYNKLLRFQCVYYCSRCMFLAHVSCAISETTQSSRDQADGQYLPPVQQNSTALISRFVENYLDGDADIGNKIDHFDHEHPLILIDEPKNEKICEACAVPISTPLYGCVECDYFIHKCCAQLPKQIHHPSHSEHPFSLSGNPYKGFFSCDLCSQWSNGFKYQCVGRLSYPIDIKCASLISHVYHEAHRHPLTPRKILSTKCTACNDTGASHMYLKCDTCNFKLCFRCAMAPPVIKHRFGKHHPFKLSYAPPENHYNEYICEICEGELDPKLWHYRCDPSDQFTHVRCMVDSGADFNIKYEASFKDEYLHEHELTLAPLAFNYNGCRECRIALNKGFSVGLECIPCNYRMHLLCFLSYDWWNWQDTYFHTRH